MGRSGPCKSRGDERREEFEGSRRASRVERKGNSREYRDGGDDDFVVQDGGIRETEILGQSTGMRGETARDRYWRGFFVTALSRARYFFILYNSDTALSVAYIALFSRGHSRAPSDILSQFNLALDYTPLSRTPLFFRSRLDGKGDCCCSLSRRTLAVPRTSLTSEEISRGLEMESQRDSGGN